MATPETGREASMPQPVDKSWTREQALAAGKDAYWKWEGLHILDGLEQKHDAGDSAALMDAVALCANRGLVMPPWVAADVFSAHTAVMFGDAESWDDVLGLPPLYGVAKRETERKHARLRFRVYQAVHYAARAEPWRRSPKPARSINDELFAEVARSFGKRGDIGVRQTKHGGLGKVHIKKLYREAKEELERRSVPDLP
jgi:hypothetical protein